MVPEPCEIYSQIVAAWRRAMKWTCGLDAALSTMLASAASTNFVGEQLWVKVIGPPSSGKTTLLEGLAVSKKYVLSKDTIRGFHSGWKTEGGEDHSLLELARGKTLATKDGDTLLKQPNLAQILSEARGIYDRVSRTHYRNATANDYVGYRMTWILCGTSALREIDDSELGQRFIDCVAVDTVDDEFEDEVNWRAVNQEARNMLQEADGTEVSQYPPELAEAMQLTGGYVEYLRQNALRLASQVSLSDDTLRYCARLGKFASFMRARPSKKQDEQVERELSYRLSKQLTRLANSTAIVLNDTGGNAEIVRRTHKVAMDTARGRTLKMAESLYIAEQKKSLPGLDLRALALIANQPEEKTRAFIRFLTHIGVVELNREERAGIPKQVRWKLTPRLTKLYREVATGQQV